ncbi:hypothetical protein PQX77_001322 [Marasmius sp. AFHP31]|nr:hypothetical protein PQX77_001322 [Marasmius sp. AFHP31]
MTGVGPTDQDHQEQWGLSESDKIFIYHDSQVIHMVGAHLFRAVSLVFERNGAIEHIRTPHQAHSVSIHSGMAGTKRSAGALTDSDTTAPDAPASSATGKTICAERSEQDDNLNVLCPKRMKKPTEKAAAGALEKEKQGSAAKQKNHKRKKTQAFQALSLCRFMTDPLFPLAILKINRSLLISRC